MKEINDYKSSLNVAEGRIVGACAAESLLSRWEIHEDLLEESRVCRSFSRVPVFGSSLFNISTDILLVPRKKQILRLSFNEMIILIYLVLLLTYEKRNHALDVISPSAKTSKAMATRGAVNDVVSKNITMVLENLLMNYENNQLPTHGKGTPTVVKTNILIRSMGPVSELDMDYSMDCYFRQSWRDSRLSFLGPIKSLSLSIKMLERIWRPDTYFYNGKHSYVHTITVPNKLLRISQDGDILYSMRLTIKAKCPMELRNFPMDRQSCPLILGSYAYTSGQLVYEWQEGSSVNFVPGMALSQFDLMGSPYRNLTFVRREGEFSVLQVSFNLQRHTGYFLIQVYVPCVLIVVLSWVSFWIHREATSDRVGLGITTVLTLSTISLDSRTDLPKVRYATALDWFLLMSFGYCIATLLEFAGVHYFTKVGSGEIPLDEEELENESETDFQDGFCSIVSCSPQTVHPETIIDIHRRRSSLICDVYGISVLRERINDGFRYFKTVDYGKTNTNGCMDTKMAAVPLLPRRR
ncbi:gamma-aminobutyric acid receptor subunit alpha-6 isoform X2 [Megachile rotundata]|uniref:gamma-aminobutyric acid receptor subunit alpha-6 isoform X2 n=1 Tax=Megachile rotundata TaxID=143995 RepID=UPI003FD62732